MQIALGRCICLLLASLSGYASAAPPSELAEIPTITANALTTKQLSSKQIDEMHLRIQLADTILHRVEADASQKGASKDWRMGLLSSLYATNSQNLQTIASSATTLDAAQGMANSAYRQSKNVAGLAKSLGSASDNLVFTPATPCRYIDTRNIGAAITTPRSFDTVLSGPAYGGASGCSIPATGASDIAVNVTVVVPPGNAGFLGFSPYGSSAQTSFINWPAGGTPGLANAGIIATAFNSSDNSNEFEAYAGGGNSPQLIMDYFGYFSAVPATALNCLTTEFNELTVGAGNHNVTSPACPAGFSIVSAMCEAASTATLNVFGVSNNTNVATCTYDIPASSGNLPIYAAAICCQLP